MINDTTSTKESDVPQEKTGGGWMRRLVRLLNWGAFNGGIAVLAWLGVNGSQGAGRLLPFVAWTFAVLLFMGSLNKEAAESVKKKGRSIPAWIGHGWGVVLIGFLVWHGWFWTAIAFLIWEIAEAAIHHQPNSQLSDPPAE